MHLERTDQDHHQELPRNHQFQCQTATFNRNSETEKRRHRRRHCRRRVGALICKVWSRRSRVQTWWLARWWRAAESWAPSSLTEAEDHGFGDEWLRRGRLRRLEPLTATCGDLRQAEPCGREGDRCSLGLERAREKGFRALRKKIVGVSPASMGVAGELRAVVRRGRDGSGVLMVGGQWQRGGVERDRKEACVLLL